MDAMRKRYLLWMSFVLDQRLQRYRALLEEFGADPKAVFDAAAKGDLPRRLKSDDALFAAMKQKADEAYIDRCLAYLKRRRIEALVPEEEGYPKLLREIYDPPAVLYVRGRLTAQLPLPIAMIGSRHCSDYGRNVALELSGQLAEAGACIVSGLAYGVDCISANGALRAKHNPFPTVAVLGNGVDVVYPPSNRRLYYEIAERGAVVSEQLPGSHPHRGSFPRRNRIISGMSRGVVVVEAAQKSGTSITVDCALEQGRDVFAVPGRVLDPMSAGTNGLIRDGMAKPIFSAQDVLEEYGVSMEAKRKAAAIPEDELDLKQALLCRLLSAGERSFDELCLLSGMGAPELSAALTSLELMGLIRQLPGRMYAL